MMPMRLPVLVRRSTRETTVAATRPAVVDYSDEGLDCAGGQVLDVLDHEQVTLLRGGRPFLGLFRPFRPAVRGGQQADGLPPTGCQP